MSAGGWNLIHTWLTDGILAKNWALIQELLELLLLCPVDIERLKSNNCPKLIKGLSKEGSHQGVRTLASRLVEQWLKIVKGEAAPNSVPAQIMTVPVQSNATVGQTAIIPSSQQQQQQQHSANAQQTIDVTENATVHMQDFKLAQQSTASISINQQDQERQQQLQERLQPQTVQVVGKIQQAQVQQQITQQQCKKQSFVVVSTSSSLPVYKITIRDGNQVLAKVETDAANISNVLNTASTSTDNGHAPNVTQEVKPEAEELNETENISAASGQDDAVDVQSDDSGHVHSEVKQTVVSSKDNQDTESVKSKDIKDSKDIISSDSGKSSDKENRDSHKKDDKKSSSSSDKKSSGHHHSSSSSLSSSSSSKSSKHGTSSSTHRSSSTSHRSSSHRSGSSSSNSKNSSSNKDRSSKDKDKHHSSSSSKHSSNRSKSERDKEREKEKEKQKKDQAEKDKATLEKVQGQALSSKMGKIPKKRTEDEKSSDANGRKSSTESRDSSKENKEKADSKKDTVAKLITEKKNISISIENRKNSQDSGTRPKTVKTFNSKFRSTGLEEEVKPPPPRSKKATPVVDKKALPPKLPLKRPSPLRDVPMVEKRVKLSLDSPTTPPSDEKKGGIKLIPPKPKRKYTGILLQIMYNISLLIRGLYHNFLLKY